MKPMVMTATEYAALANVFPVPPAQPGAIVPGAAVKTRHAVACRGDRDNKPPPPAARCTGVDFQTLESEFVAQSVKGRFSWFCRCPYRPGDVCYLSTPLDLLAVEGDLIQCIDATSELYVTRRAPQHVAKAKELLLASKGNRTRWVGIVPPEFASLDRVVVDEVYAPRLLSSLPAEELDLHGGEVAAGDFSHAHKPSRRDVLFSNVWTHGFGARERDINERDAWVWCLRIRRTFAEHLPEAAR